MNSRWLILFVVLVGFSCGEGMATLPEGPWSGDGTSPTSTIRGGVAGDNLGGTNLGGANLAGSNIGGVNLGGPNLGGINLGGANLGATNLGGTNLGGTNLGGANLGGTNLGGPNLGGPNLGGTNLGGTNLGGSNLAGNNLGGNNLGGPNLAGTNLVGTNLAGIDLSAANAGLNIHQEVNNGMLYSGEDLFSDAAKRCVVVGVGSVAFSRLVEANSGHMKSVLRRLPWWFTDPSGDLRAWEFLMWGNSTYCTFVLMVPESATYPGVKGFIKALWRWNAPPSRNLSIPQVEVNPAGQGVDTYSGMMDMARRVILPASDPNSVTHRAHLAGELAFVSATTNNQPVNVDFASWVRKTNNAGERLGEVSGNPIYMDGTFQALEAANGAIKIGMFSHGPRQSGGVMESAVNIRRKALLVNAGLATELPLAKRCAGAVASSNASLMNEKCDAYLNNMAWVDIPNAFTWFQAGSTTLPYAENLLMESTTPKSQPTYRLDYGTEQYPVISETYIHLNEPPYENFEWVDRSGASNPKCRDVAGGDDSIENSSVYCVAAGAAGTNTTVHLWDYMAGGWSSTGKTGVRVSYSTQGLWVVAANGDVYRRAVGAGTFTTIRGAGCRDIGSGGFSADNGTGTWCIGSGTGDTAVKRYNPSTKKFESVTGLTANRVSVDNAGRVYFARTDGSVYTYNPGPVFPQVFPAGTCQGDIAFNFHFYCTNASNQVRRFDPDLNTWAVILRGATPVTAAAIGLDPYGGLWTADTTSGLTGNLMNRL